MKSINANYLLVGSGRLAKHLKFWLNHYGYVVDQWNRGLGLDQLQEAMRAKPRVLLAISDSSLESFFTENLKIPLRDSGLHPVHFSGAFHHPEIISAHPLMTFSENLYPEDFYCKIHWTLCGVSSLEAIFPQMRNTYSVITAEQKPLYHAACVLGGNLPVLLWREMARIFSELGLSSDLTPEMPTSAYLAFLSRVLENFAANPQNALTGPIIRGDMTTIAANLKALDQNPWREVYQACLKAYQTSNQAKEQSFAPSQKLTKKVIETL
ncbi:MAG: DUF2520 domain-containing protein [Bdellovibrionaceae bacterium]|nr:DUF2520 domain-containing protein [Pseudobdellovibrionaceae bacterium]